MADKEGLDGRTTLKEVFDATRATAPEELTDAEFRFWMMVRSMESADRGCYADTEYLMNLLQRSESHVRKVRPSLARKGWLKVDQRGRRGPELRAVVPPGEGVHENEPQESLGVHEDEPQGPGVHLGVHSQEHSPTPPIKESTGSTISSNFPEKVLAVFDYWQDRRSKIPNTKKAKPTQKRLSKVQARLRDGHTVEDLKLAVDGCLSNEFNVNGGYIDLELICRDDAHVTQYIVKVTNSKPDGGTYIAERAPRV